MSQMLALGWWQLTEQMVEALENHSIGEYSALAIQSHHH
jgi:hypothetical protein